MRIDLLRFNQAILLNLQLFRYHTWRMFRRNPGQLYCIRRPISSAASRSIFLVLVSAESCCLSWPPLGITLREGWCLKEGLGSKRLHQASLKMGSRSSSMSKRLNGDASFDAVYNAISRCSRQQTIQG
jgi:hypothetical protein